MCGMSLALGHRRNVVHYIAGQGKDAGKWQTEKSPSCVNGISRRNMIGICAAEQTRRRRRIQLRAKADAEHSSYGDNRW